MGSDLRARHGYRYGGLALRLGSGLLLYRRQDEALVRGAHALEPHVRVFVDLAL